MARLSRKKKYSRGHTLKKSLKGSLTKGIEMNKAIALPPGEDLNEWLAMLTAENFNSANLCWGFVSQHCSSETCPKMNAGPNYTYLWQDPKSDKYAKSTELCAFDYIKELMLWVSDQMDDEGIFPSTTDGKFPKNFIKTVKKIWTRLIRVYFHVYYHHWPQIEKVEAEPHVNTSFKWLYYASMEFQIMEQTDLDPMKEVIKKIPDLLTTTIPNEVKEKESESKD